MRSAKRINGFLISTALVISLVTPITAGAKLYDQSGRGQADIVPINL